MNKKTAKRLFFSSAMPIILLYMAGCATFKTVSHPTRESPKLYSGTRLDIHAIRGNQEVLKVYRDKYKVVPPEQPKLDLPLSFIFDTTFLFITFPIALYEAVFPEWL